MKARLTALGLIFGIGFYLTACAVGTDNVTGFMEPITDSRDLVTDDITSSDTKENGSSSDTADSLIELKDSDHYFDYTKETYSLITLNGDGAVFDSSYVSEKDGVITISGQGVYVLTGSYSGSIVVDAGDNDKVYLVLENVDITATDGPAIYEKNADKVIVLLPGGTDNSLADSSVFSDTSEDAPNGALWSNDSLTINGAGSLTVKAGFEDGIVSKDKLKIMSGNITVEAYDEGIRGNDLVYTSDAVIKIKSGDKGIKSDTYICVEGGILTVNAEDDAFNCDADIYIADSDIIITSGDDAIHADGNLTIESGVINIAKSHEGLEGNVITINDGNISIIAEDDGLNATRSSFGSSNMTDKEDPFSVDESANIFINGGSIYVDSKGDGIDSNGNITVTGGYIYVSGAENSGNNATDYQGTFLVNGGTVIATGMSGMYQSVSEDSACFVIDCTGVSINAGDTVEVYGPDNDLLESVTVPKKADSFMLSSDYLIEGEEYTLIIGNASYTYAAGTGSSVMTGMGFGGPDGGRPDAGGFTGGQRPEFGDGEIPDFGNFPDGQRPEFGDGEIPDFGDLPDGQRPDFGG